MPYSPATGANASWSPAARPAVVGQLELDPLQERRLPVGHLVAVLIGGHDVAAHLGHEPADRSDDAGPIRTREQQDVPHERHRRYRAEPTGGPMIRVVSGGSVEAAGVSGPVRNAMRGPVHGPPQHSTAFVSYWADVLKGRARRIPL